MVEQIQPQEYRTLKTKGKDIIDNGTRWANSLEELQADFAHLNCVIIPVAEVPSDWRDMTIVDGVLVLASAEVIAAREVARGIAETEAVSQARAADYTAKVTGLNYDVLEFIATLHPENPACKALVDKKAEIRLAHPKPTTTQQEAE